MSERNRERLKPVAPERIFNVFLFINDGYFISQIGATAHQSSGSDDEKIHLLQEKVDTDYRVCKRYPVPDSCVVVGADGTEHKGLLAYGDYLLLQRIGKHMQFLEYVMEDLKAPREPLLCVTPIVEGRPCIEAVTDLTPAMTPLSRN